MTNDYWSVAGNHWIFPSETWIWLFLQLEVQYYHHHAAFSTAVGLKQNPIVDLSVTLGTPTFAIGAEASYETAAGKLAKYTAGVSVTKPDSCAAIVL